MTKDPLTVHLHSKHSRMSIFLLYLRDFRAVRYVHMLRIAFFYLEFIILDLSIVHFGRSYFLINRPLVMLRKLIFFAYF